MPLSTSLHNFYLLVFQAKGVLPLPAFVCPSVRLYVRTYVHTYIYPYLRKLYWKPCRWDACHAINQVLPNKEKYKHIYSLEKKNVLFFPYDIFASVIMIAHSNVNSAIHSRLLTYNSRCKMVFIESMHPNEPNVAYFLAHNVWYFCLCWFQLVSLSGQRACVSGPIHRW